MILLRPLMETSHELAYIGDHESEREELALLYLRDAVRRDLDLHRNAGQYGVEVDEVFVASGEQVLHQVVETLRALGPRTGTRFPTLREILRSRNEEELCWFWREWSGSVHSSYLALNDYVDEERRSLFRWNSDPEDVERVTYFASAFLDRAIAAIMVLLDLVDEERVADLLSLRIRYDALAPEDARPAGG